MRKLIETFEARLAINPTIAVSTESMISEWGSTRYGALSHLLVWLRYLQFVHQTNHWMARGQASYGDHLLFQRLYEEIADQIDALAEKIVGLSDEAGVHLTLQTSQLDRLSRECVTNTVTSNDELAKKSLDVEYNFLKVVEHVKEMLASEGKLTYGLDNALAGLADVHEGYVYLLKQRCVK